MNSIVHFGDERVKEAFEKLKDSKGLNPEKPYSLYGRILIPRLLGVGR